MSKEPMTVEDLREKLANELGGNYEDPDVQPVVRLIIQTFLQFCKDNNIKQVVEGELPRLPTSRFDTNPQSPFVYKTAQEDMLKAGYVKVKKVRLTDE